MAGMPQREASQTFESERTVFLVLNAGEVIDRVYADYDTALARAAEIDGWVLSCEVR